MIGVNIQDTEVELLEAFVNTVHLDSSGVGLDGMRPTETRAFTESRANLVHLALRARRRAGARRRIGARGKRWSHPYFWAAFLSSGRWTPMDPASQPSWSSPLMP